MQKKKKKSGHWWMWEVNIPLVLENYYLMQKKKKSHVTDECGTFQCLSFLLALLINANISKIPSNIHQCSGWELSHSSVTTRNWLWIQEFNKSQWKHSVRFSWLCGIYRKEYCISRYLERRCYTFLISLNLMLYVCILYTFQRAGC